MIKRKLNIVIAYLPEAFLRSGGLQNQIYQTQKELEGLGHTVWLVCDYITSHQNENIDIYHQFSINPHLIGLFREISKRASRTIVSTVYNFPKLGLKNHLRSFFKRGNNFPYEYEYEMLNCADLVVTLSDREDSELKKRFKRVNIKSRIIPNGVTQNFITLSAKTRRKKDYIVIVGTIYPLKNQLQLIKCCQKNKIKLKIIGPVGDPEYYEKCVAAASPEFVEFVGYIENTSPEYMKLIAEALIVTIPSDREVFPLTLLESLHLGTFTLITRNCFIGNFYDPRYMKFIDRDFESTLISTYSNLKRKSLDVDTKYLAQFNWLTVAKSLDRCYNSIC